MVTRSRPGLALPPAEAMKLQELGVPLMRLGSADEALQLGEYYESIRKIPTPGLRKEYEALGLPLVKGIDRVELLSRLKKVALWSVLPIDELEREAALCGEPAGGAAAAGPGAGDPERHGWLVDRLYMHLWVMPAWEADGFPVKRIGSGEEAGRVVGEYRRLEALTDRNLWEEYGALGFPEEEGLRRQDLLSRFKAVLIWNALPFEELVRECRDRRFLPEGKGTGLTGSEEEQKQEMLQWLYADMCPSLFGLDANVPVKRLDNLGTAAYVNKQFEKMSAMGLEELQGLCKEWNLPLQPNLSREGYLSRLKDATVWWQLPLLELKKECAARAISISGIRLKGPDEDKRGQLLDLLLFYIFKDAFRAMGLPVQQLSSLNACWELSEDWAGIEGASSSELTKRYQGLGLPTTGLQRKDLVERLKKTSLWMAVPFADLQKECRAHHVNSIGTEEERGELVGRLLGAHWLPKPEPEPPPRPQPGHGHVPPPWQGQGQASPPWQRFGFPPPPPPQPEKPRTPGVTEKAAAHFRALGLPVTAGLDDVKKAYRRLALKHHPDKNQGGESGERAAKEFLKVSEAHAALVEFLKTSR